MGDVAIVPGTSNPAQQIAISNVNAQDNPQYFSPNYVLPPGTTDPRAALLGTKFTEYDGMTTLLNTTAITAVAGRPINITIVIAGGLGRSQGASFLKRTQPTGELVVSPQAAPPAGEARPPNPCRRQAPQSSAPHVLGCFFSHRQYTDVADAILDSAVFLKTGSLSVDPANTTIAVTLTGNWTRTYRWCGARRMHLQRLKRQGRSRGHRGCAASCLPPVCPTHHPEHFPPPPRVMPPGT